MLKELDAYLKDVQATDLGALEKDITSHVLDPTGGPVSFDIKIRDNPAFLSKSRVAPGREMRKLEITADLRPKILSDDCMFCDPEKCAKFAPETGLEKQYFLNDSMSFSNWFTSGEIHGVVVYNYKQHIIRPKDLTMENWLDSLNLVKKIGKLTKKSYVSLHNNFGSKAAASLEHFHGQFHCEDMPLARTQLSMERSNRAYWKSWVKAMNNIDMVVDFDEESKTVLYVEWSPVFGKVELVIINLESPSFVTMSEKETDAVARFLQRSVSIVSEISDQMNIVNLSAAQDDDYCNQFRVFPRAPMNKALKVWEGYLEFMGETVPHIDPEKIAELARQIG
ncbi:MAG: hypothetical protein V1818_04250 [Candidatus Aenigmatarchaeota archaeon]